MAINSLYPAFVKINYLSEKAPHVMTLPTREWNAAVGDNGGYVAWDDSEIPFEDMVADLVSGLVSSVPDDTTFLDATAFTMSAPVGVPAIPVAFTVIEDGEGLAVGEGIDAAQATFSFRTEDGGYSRIVLLDIEPSVEFRPRHPGSFISNDFAIETAWTAMTSAWAGRDGSRPSLLRRVVFTLNDSLRRSYKYT